MQWKLSPDRCFSSDPAQRRLARTLYERVKRLPLFCPHGHVPPQMLADPTARFGTPVELFILPDHYVLRMLVSQGVSLEQLGIAPRDGGWYETDHRVIWQRFAEHFHLFRATPTGLWLATTLIELFGVEERLTAENAQRIYDYLQHRLTEPDFTPRALFRRFQIELLATTDTATDSLAAHRDLHVEGFGNVRPTFRPDALLALDAPDWRTQIDRLSTLSGVEVHDYHSFITAIEQRRAAFKALGALATDHGVETPYTAPLSNSEAETIFARAMRGTATTRDTARFTAHMLIEFARMSCEDGLVMQLHAGSLRNHHTALLTRFGPDKGADIPVATEWTRNLRPLLNAYGSDPRFRLILFTLDESSYSRELAPLAGYYSAVRLGPPWWFFDSVQGMRRYFDLVIETAGFYNTAGFNDDTRAFCSIPARHDVWRRVSCDWLARQVVEGLLTEDEASELAVELAIGLARRAYQWQMGNGT
ncbi:glucuronate isomerase [uncultured Chloroflexus sp.]|uniref:glucuronate isomerase n=1 Tax=uncultured Chloroflexus sp. TaxID=214040 RepID=UPI002606058B|nr:glucuronate isomerase [uncultured Chloroflexus sp.]